MAAHGEQLAEHGGAEGVRDAGALDGAMTRPRNLANYGEPDAAALAAAYAFGIARNHPFVDGNKRTAAVVAEPNLPSTVTLERLEYTVRAILSQNCTSRTFCPLAPSRRAVPG